MKIRLFLSLFLLSMGGIIAPAHAEITSPTPAAKPEFALVVVDSLNRGGAITAFDRFDLAFQELIERRKWPVKLVAERFAANLPAHETELRIFNQPLREETSGDLTFRGWVTLTVRDKKYDFGIVTFRYYPRFQENRDDVLEKVFRGAANAAADKVEPILFPKSDIPKT